MPARRLLVSVAAPLAAALLLPSTARAQAPVRSISAVASARVVVNRDVAQNSRAIAAAVEAARNRAIPRAIANAREEAARLAAAGGLTLGPLLGVVEPDQPPFFFGPGGGPSGPYGAEGTFGPGRFCGTIRTAIRRRDSRGARRPTGRFRRRFGCRVPAEVAQTVRATFAVG